MFRSLSVRGFHFALLIIIHHHISTFLFRNYQFWSFRQNINRRLPSAQKFLTEKPPNSMNQRFICPVVLGKFSFWITFMIRNSFFHNSHLTSFFQAINWKLALCTGMVATDSYSLFLASETWQSETSQNVFSFWKKLAVQIIFHQNYTRVIFPQDLNQKCHICRGNFILKISRFDRCIKILRVRKLPRSANKFVLPRYSNSCFYKRRHLASNMKVWIQNFSLVEGVLVEINSFWY